MVLVARNRMAPSGGEGVPPRVDYWALSLGAALVVVVAQLDKPGGAAQLALVAAAAGTFVLRGRRVWLSAELWAALVVPALLVAVWGTGALETGLFLGALVVLGTSLSLDSLARASTIAVVTGLAAPVINLSLVGSAEIGWINWSAANLLILAMGRLIRRQRLLVVELEETRLALAEAAVEEERRRIARELHDVAGHTLAAVLVHLNGARHLLRRDPPAAESALDDAVDVGRRGLDQIRSTVVTLRRHERGTDAPGAEAGDVIALVDDCRRAGVEVEMEIDEAASRLDGPLGTACHRIAAEALTNAMRHAPGNAVALGIHIEGNQVVLVVEDHGRSPSPSSTDGRHFGLVGMAERAGALGGELEAGPTAHGWRVAARLPAIITPYGS